MSNMERTFTMGRGLNYSPQAHNETALDLSCTNRSLTVERYYVTYGDLRHETSHIHKNNNVHYTQHYSPDSTSTFLQYDEDYNRRMCTPDRVPEALSPPRVSPTKSPSLYRAETKVSPQISPNYVSCYPNIDQLNPQVLQTACLQSNLLQTQLKVNPKIERDDVSETGSEGSNASILPMYPLSSSSRYGKVARPFKAYPKDPISLASCFTTADAILNTQSAEKYSAFRERMLKQIYEANGGQATVSNPKMRRTVNTGGYSSEDGKSRSEDPSRHGAYFERRKKNNAAAKKSRDRRRIKEDEIAIRAAFLERENIELKFELAAARKQLAICGKRPVSGTAIKLNSV